MEAILDEDFSWFVNVLHFTTQFAGNQKTILLLYSMLNSSSFVAFLFT